MSPKKLTEDIVAPTRKSRLPRKDITISLSAKRKEDAPVSPPGGRTPPPREQKTPAPGIPLWFGAALIGLALCIGFGAWFLGGVEVEVTARQESAVYAGSVIAYASDTPAAEGGSVLSYQNQTFARQVSEEVPATERKKVEERATGRITVYNDFSAAPQRLIKNTRFETPDGLVYRIDSSIDVPGQKTVAGKTTPGSIEVTVFADEPGDRYNIGPSDFTIPGFKGKPQFAKFIGKSTGSISGGFSGERLVPDPVAVEAARGRLRAKLETELRDAITNEAPMHSILLRTHPVAYESLPQSDGSGSVTITESGKQIASFVDHAKLAEALAANALPAYNNEPIGFAEPFSFTLTANAQTSTEESDDPTKMPLAISFGGTVSFVWKFDSAAIQKDLAGRSSTDIEQILGERHPGVASAKAKFRPFCIRCVFPEDPAKIKVGVPDVSLDGKTSSGI